MVWFNKKIASAIGLVYLITEAASVFGIIYILRSYLSLDAATTWVFFTSLIPIAQLTISGYGPLITREVAIATASDSDQLKIPALLATRTLRLLRNSIIFILICMLSLVIYQYINKDFESIPNIIIFSSVIAARAYMTFIFSYYLGLRQYGIDKLVMLFCSVSSFILVYISANLFNGLTYIIGAYAIPYIVSAIFVAHLFNKIKIVENNQMQSDKTIETKEILKMYTINFAGFLTLNTDLYIAKAYLDKISYLEFGVVSKVMLGMISASSIIIAIQSSSYSTSYAMKNLKNLIKQVRSTASIISIFVVAFGFIFIAVYDILVRAITFEDRTFGILIVALWLIYTLVAVNTMNIGMAIISIGDSDLVKVAFPIAVLGLIGAVVGASIYGATGMILAMSFFGMLSLAMHMRLFRMVLNK